MGSLFEMPLQRLDPSRRHVALTFDDGPNPEATPRVLDALSAAGVAATFFILGKHAVRWPQLVSRAAVEGHLLGNHGFLHRKLHLCGPAFIRTDLERGTDAVLAASGVTPGFFRAPHGYLNPWVLLTARSLGQRVVDWTLGVWDTAIRDPGEITRRVVRGTRPGTIILLHDGDAYDPAGDRLPTAAALPGMIAELRERGFEFVTLPTG